MRKIILEDTSLSKLLQSRSAYIGSNFISGAGLIFGGINTLYQAIPAGYFLICMGIAMLLLGGYNLWRSRYNWKTLLKEIVEMDQTAHHHSIVAIKNTFDAYPNRFLVYEDTEWGCRFFPNYPTQETEEANEENIRKHLSRELKIPMENITLTQKGSELQEKYSVKHKCNKYYDHTFYEAHISSFPDMMKKRIFQIDGRDYEWMTMDEMEKAPDIQEKNLDVVGKVNRLGI